MSVKSMSIEVGGTVIEPFVRRMPRRFRGAIEVQRRHGQERILCDGGTWFSSYFILER